MGDDAAPGPALHLGTKQPGTATPGTRCAGEAKFYFGKIKIRFQVGGSERSFKHIFLKFYFEK